MSNARLLIVGEITEYPSWKLLGVFNNREKAKVACRNHKHFFVYIKFNEKIPDRIPDWVAAIFPKITCGFGCDWVPPYGWVPEAGCPKHDTEKRFDKSCPTCGSVMMTQRGNEPWKCEKCQAVVAFDKNN